MSKKLTKLTFLIINLALLKANGQTNDNTNNNKNNNFTCEEFIFDYYKNPEFTCFFADINLESKTKTFTPVVDKPEKYKRVDIYASIIPVFDNKICDAFTNLERLYLQSNHIEYIDINAFDSCHKLRDLKINDNKITHLDDNVFETIKNVEELDIHRNSLTDFSPELLKNMKNLKKLDLRENNLKDLDVVKIIDYVSGIKEIWFDYNLIPQEKLSEIASIIYRKIKKSCRNRWYIPYYWKNLSKYATNINIKIKNCSRSKNMIEM